MSEVYLQLEESVGNLKHQNVGVVVLVADQDALRGPAHTMELIVLLQALQTGKHGRIFLRLSLLGAKGVVR